MDAAEIRIKLPDIPESPSGDSGARSGWNESQMRELDRLKSPTKAKAVATRVVAEVKEAQAKGG